MSAYCVYCCASPLFLSSVLMAHLNKALDVNALSCYALDKRWTVNCLSRLLELSCEITLFTFMLPVSLWSRKPYPRARLFSQAIEKTTNAKTKIYKSARSDWLIHSIHLPMTCMLTSVCFALFFLHETKDVWKSQWYKKKKSICTLWVMDARERFSKHSRKLESNSAIASCDS